MRALAAGRLIGSGPYEVPWVELEAESGPPEKPVNKHLLVAPAILSWRILNHAHAYIYVHIHMQL